MADIIERLQGQPIRLLILTACAFARTVEHLLTDKRSRTAIDVAERVADGLATKEEVSAAAKAAEVAEREARRKAREELEWYDHRSQTCVMGGNPPSTHWDADNSYLAACESAAQGATAALQTAQAAVPAETAARAAQAAEQATKHAAEQAAWKAEAAARVEYRDSQSQERVEAAGKVAAETAKLTHHSICDCILSPRIQHPFPAHLKGLATTIYESRDLTLMPILADALEEIGLGAFAQHCRQPIHAKGCHVLDSILGLD